MEGLLFVVVRKDFAPCLIELLNKAVRSRLFVCASEYLLDSGTVELKWVKGFGTSGTSDCHAEDESKDGTECCGNDDVFCHDCR